MPIVQDNIKNLSDEQLDELERELRRKQATGGDVATTVGEGLLSGARGALAVSQGRALPDREKKTTTSGEDIETFEKKERIKAQIKQEFGGTGGGLQMVSLPGGGFAFIPGGQAKGNGEGVPAGVVGGTGEPQELENVKLNFGGVKGDVPKSERQQEREATKERKTKILDIQTASQKELTEKFGQAARVVQMLSNLEGFGKAIDEDFPHGTGAMAKLAGYATKFPLRSEQFQKDTISVKNYIAQMEETKIAAIPILSGQARYVVDLARAIQTTIPTEGEITDSRQNLISQSTRNIMTLVYGVQNGQLGAQKLFAMGIDPNSSPESLEDEQARILLSSVQLTPQQEQAIEEGIDAVLETRAIRKGKESSLQDVNPIDKKYQEYLELEGGF